MGSAARAVPRPHVIVLGGFLGAGKTTAVRALATYLTQQGIRVAVITNDQGHGLVDTAIARSCGLEAAEIAGGCFCCRFDEFLDASRRFIDRLQPDVLIAEAVGSCTDLAATVTYPLQRLHGDTFTVAPLSVVVDPLRALEVLTVPGSPGDFSADVRYLYRAQLAEADVVAINKCDLLSPSQLGLVDAAVAEASPRAIRRVVSTRTGEGLDAWFRTIVLGRQQPRAPIDVDYDRYAAGEAALGWVNLTLRVTADPPCPANELLERLGSAIVASLQRSGAHVAHLKVALSGAGGERGPLATLHVVHDDVLAHDLSADDPFTDGALVVNLRAEGDPVELASRLEAALAAAAGHVVLLTVERREAFRPSRPVPTYRDRAVG